MTTPGTRTPGAPSARTAPDPPGGRALPRPFRAPGAAVALPPAGVMLALGLWRLEGRGPWRDEAATLDAATRGWSETWHLLQHVDAVHGLYYLLMHGVLLVFGDGLTALRLPSVLAMAGAAAGVALIGRRLAGPVTGLTAGLLFAVTPFASRYAQEGRSYALVTAGVVGAGLLLLRAWERPTARRWACYAACVLLVGLLHEFALLVLPAHGAAVLLTRGAGRRVRLAWTASAAAAAACAVPLALLSSSQAAQVVWLPQVDGRTPLALLESFAGPAPRVTAAVLTLAVLGLLVPLRRPGAPVTVRALTLPWLLLPPALLMAVSLATPLYYDRYVLYSLPGLTLLAGAGLEGAVRAAVRPLAPSVRRTAAVAAGAVLAASAAAGVLATELHQQRHLRTPLARADDFRGAADVLRAGARPGDAVLFAPDLRRSLEAVYPDAFRGTADVLLARTPDASGTFAGVEVPVARFAEVLLPHARVWMLAGRGRWTTGQDREQELQRVLDAHYRRTAETRVRGFVVQLWTRR
ncbi:glycosyltransferase family 39 protein [Streptomyces sp. NPDC001380]|uniref:glycosyltransferase family 39 protein n=1 Tax=Streptomyces sp. NPDC001380 TaxID=3364566 RepID=UPI0036A041AE